MARFLRNLRIDEVSSVDRGAGEGVKVMLMKRHARGPDLYTSVEKGDLADDAVAYLKREFSADERRSAADSGAALPDGSFPIKTKGDLENAIRAIGRAKDPAKAKAHIKARASALGATDMLPEDWTKRDDAAGIAEMALAICAKQIMADREINDKAAAIAKLFEEYQDFIAGQVPADKESDMPSLQELAKAFNDAITDAIAKLSPEFKAYCDTLDQVGKNAFAQMTDEQRKAEMAKAADAKKKPMAGEKDGEPEPDADDEAKKVAKQFEDVLKAERDKNEALKKRLDALEEKDQKVQFGKRAVEIGLSESDGDLLLKAHRGDPEALIKMEDKIKALTAQVTAGDVFKEFGTKQAGGGASAHDQLVAKAAELRKVDPKLTAEQAYVKALEDPANRDLVAMEKRDRDMKLNRVAQ